MKTENIKIRAWLGKANAEQKKQLAQAAETSVMHLMHIAAGRRQISPELAQRIAHASTGVIGMYALDQRELCSICARCPLVN